MRRTLDNRLTRWSRRFVRARTGATAVEFALLALPFLTLLFGILELGLIFVVSAALDNAMTEVSRTIRTGEINASTYNSASGLRGEICKQMGWGGPDCGGNLAVEVRKLTSYTLPPSPFTDGKFRQDLNYDATGENDIVMVRAYYKWTVIAPLLSKGMATSADGTRLLTSTLVFRNEPYGS